MVLTEFFRRPPPIATPAAFEDFLDGNGAFVSQKAVFEYSRAAAGYLWQPLFEEEMFKAALERSRWLAYPLGLAAVAEAAEGLLREPAGHQAPAMLDGLLRALQAVFGRHQPSPQVEPEEWTEARAACLERTRALQLRPPRPVKDIPIDLAETMFGLLPVHEKIRGRDPVLMRNNLTANLLKVHAEFDKRADRPSLAAALAGL